MSRKVYYVAHPVSYKPDIGAIWKVHHNIINAKKWMAYLIGQDRRHVYIAPWIVEVEQWLKGRLVIDYEDALKDDLEVVKRCDGIIAVGGMITPGMQREIDECKLFGNQVIDLAELRSPPKPSDNTLVHKLVQQVLRGYV